MHFKASPLFLALALAATALIGCAQGPTVPTAGTTLDEKSFKDFFPTPAKGMKWVYTVTSTQAGSQPTESSLEVTEVNGDVFGYTAIYGSMSPSTGSASVKTPLAMFSLPADTVIKSEGSADIKIGDKEYRGTAKVSPSTNTDAYKQSYWLGAGTGVVKLEVMNTRDGQSVTTIAELKSFTK